MIACHIFILLYLYWHFIVFAVTTYITVRIFYIILRKKYYQLNQNKKPSDNFAEEAKEFEELCHQNDDMEVDPALPTDLKLIPLEKYNCFSETEVMERSNYFYTCMKLRRSIRHYSTKQVPKEVIRNIIKAAGTAPSGVHTEPWTFVVVSKAKIKEQIREIVEQEEEIYYAKRKGNKMTNDLIPLRTKQYLTDAPYLILVFKQMYSFTADGRRKIYCFNEISINISVGLMLAGINYAGLATLISYPLNCDAGLRCLLHRPSSEKLLLLITVGYPVENCAGFETQTTG